MIRANNYAQGTKLTEQLTQLLKHLLLAEYIIAAVLIAAVGIRVLAGQVKISLLFTVWVGLEWLIFVWILGRRKNIKEYPELNAVVARKWRSETQEFLLNWHFAKLISLLLSILSLIQGRQYYTLNLQTLLSLLTSAAFIFLAIRIRKKVSHMLLTLRKLNRIFMSLLTEFGQEQVDLNHERSQNFKILHEIY